jgi:2-deoxy-D-gluconate 3-dehydrogenase
MNKFRLDGKCGLVTGGSRGIGFGIAKALAEAGADIALVARSEDQLREARERLEATGRRIWLFPFDMGQVDGIDELYARITAETGGIDILINNAGGTRRGPAESMSSEDWDFVINLNLTSVFTLCRAFARQRIESGNPGKIVNIASLMSESVQEQNTPYAASKGGIRQLTKALAVD